MKHFIILIILLGISVSSIQAQSKTASISDWKILSGCYVKIYVPADVEFVKDDSVDTCERQYRGKNIFIHITVTEWNIGGEYSNWIEYCLVKTKINTKSAEIITSYKPKISENDVFENGGFDYTAMLLMPQFVKGKGNLIIRTWSQTLEDRDKVIKIFHSLQFDNK